MGEVMKKRIFTTEITEKNLKSYRDGYFLRVSLLNFVRSVVCIFVFFLFSISALAQQDSVTTQLAEDHVDITTGFDGATLSVFGVKNGPGQVAVIVTGPRHQMTVRRKENVFGAWMNRTGLTFLHVPVYYNYATSVPENELAPKALLDDNGIGLDAVQPQTNSWFGRALQGEFRAALIRNKQQEGLYAREAQPIISISDNFFRANFYLPAHVRTGDYEIKTIYFRNKTVRDHKTLKLRVAHVGTAANILSFERDHTLTYAFMCIFLALFAGWISNRIRRRT
jgi:uncharacterized protein (TIGR02186 family)